MELFKSKTTKVPKWEISWSQKKENGILQDKRFLIRKKKDPSSFSYFIQALSVSSEDLVEIKELINNQLLD